MDILVFEARAESVKITFIAALLISVVFLILLIFLNRNKRIQASFRQFGMLLGGFLLVLCLGTAIFSFWQWSRLGPVSISDNYIMIQGDSLPMNEVIQSRIVSEPGSRGLMSVEQGEPDVFLHIETRSKKSYVLMEENYDIAEIRTRLNEILQVEEQ
ncbi:MAG: hypothetical protein IPI60_10090 [Saprospiraceae bacterium]|nr:hypothetical protein [Saprospiraceae bacterium]